MVGTIPREYRAGVYERRSVETGERVHSFYEPRGVVMELTVNNVEEWLGLHGHGHVVPNKYERKAKCGGPSMCDFCKMEELMMKMFSVVEGEVSKTFQVNKCTCHERDSSQVCEYCYSLGFRGHMQR